ncbi:hypothetical protein DFR85_01990 [Acidianus brierleyi]|uniref:Uncharacterized protein n=1 Tax=Acidianus brierleyi TaxID=41673 RepID=A0A2U9IIJ9_9CREN|nr:hypothetical protein DFR85_01990 [Acidianus brierleyi]
MTSRDCLKYFILVLCILLIYLIILMQINILKNIWKNNNNYSFNLSI